MKKLFKCQHCGTNNRFELIKNDDVVCSKCHAKTMVISSKKYMYPIPYDKYKEFVSSEWCDIKRIFYIYSPLIDQRDRIVELVKGMVTENDLVIDSTIFNNIDFDNYSLFPEALYGEWLCTKESSPVVDFVINQMVTRFFGTGVELYYAYFSSGSFVKDIKLLFPEEELKREKEKALTVFNNITIGVNDER